MPLPSPAKVLHSKYVSPIGNHIQAYSVLKFHFQIFPAFGAFTCFNRQTMSRRMSPMVLVIPVTSCFCKPNASACSVKSCKDQMHILTTRGVIDGQPSLTKTRKHTCPLPLTFTASHHRLTGVTNIVCICCGPSWIHSGFMFINM